MDIITAVKGFKDILPEEARKWSYAEEIARRIFSNFGYKEIRVPVLEKTDLFKRGIGEATDIVEKEMYTFLDRGDELLSLRPEATAGIIRAYIEHSLQNVEPVSKLYTIGPMFRRERPQRGRFRQFHQINVECIGLEAPQIDAELMLMLFHYLYSLDLGGLKLEVNSLGCPKCRPGFRQKITAYLKENRQGLCPDCTRRVETNPLRVFDCKVEDCREFIRNAPTILEDLCPDCIEHFERVREHLDIFDVPFEINPRMVRGLDYYTRTAFEITTEALGAQNAVAGGGRYDGLVRDLGGPDVPGIGFAIGLERLMTLAPSPEDHIADLPQLFVASLGRVPQVWAFALCNYLRMLGLKVEMGYGEKSLKSQMKRSGKLQSRFTLILGEKELEEGKAELRNMDEGTQETVSLENFDQLAETIMKKLGGR